MYNNGGGNPNHDEQGRFTSAGNQSSGKLNDKGKNPFRKKQKYALPGFGGMEDAWDGLMNAAQNVVDNRKSQPTPETPEDKVRAMGFDDENDKETQKWINAGYSERMADLPTTVTIADNDDYYDYSDDTIDVEADDIIEFFNNNGANLTSEDIENIKDNGVIPYRLYKDYYDEEFFIDFVRKKHSSEIDDRMEAIEDNKKYSSNPYGFLGLSEKDFH